MTVKQWLGAVSLFLGCASMAAFYFIAVHMNGKAKKRSHEVLNKLMFPILGLGVVLSLAGWALLDFPSSR